MPCLNEAESIGFCLDEIFETAAQHQLELEVIVADNGSTDQSVAVAREKGARVIHVSEIGYGAALAQGIQSAQHDFIIMGDADGSYVFKDIPKIISRLAEGNDLVMGCRFPYGGGKIHPGAMPFLHKYLGNPCFSLFVRAAFRIPVRDVYCGLRGFTRDFYDQIQPESKGMEFAIEMLLRAALYKFKVAEFPTELRCDLRETSTPHLRTFRDGWRTLRLLLTYSPEGLYLLPALALIGSGAVGVVSGFMQLEFLGITLSLHSATLSSLLLLSGSQYLILGGFIIGFSWFRGMRPMPAWFQRLSHVFNLEKGIISAILLSLTAFACFMKVFYPWVSNGFGPLNYESNMPYIITSVMLALLGLQLFFASFMFDFLLHDKRQN